MLTFLLTSSSYINSPHLCNTQTSCLTIYRIQTIHGAAQQPTDKLSRSYKAG